MLTAGTIRHRRHTEWIEQVSAKVDAADAFADVPAAARPLVRRSAILAAAAKDARLRKRTLTNLYNERPQWPGGYFST